MEHLFFRHAVAGDCVMGYGVLEVAALWGEEEVSLVVNGGQGVEIEDM